MACVCKEYRRKIKMVQEQRIQLKIKILLAFNMKIVYQCDRNEPLVGEVYGGYYSWWERDEWIFVQWARDSPIPPVQKTMLSPQKVWKILKPPFG